MMRLFLAILVTVLTVVFIMANTHDVELDVVFGTPVRIRLIFLLLSTFILGVVVSSLFGMVAKVRFKRRILREVERMSAQPQGEPVTE